MKEIIDEINKSLEIASEDKDLPLDLLRGKMGLCIYFYRLGRGEGNERYRKRADRLLDEIFENIGTVKSIDIEYGLSGIGLGISYLIRGGYVEGDENEVLREIDDEIFKQVTTSDKIGDEIFILIQILYYASQRKPSLIDEQEYLWDELIRFIINTLHTKVDRILEDNSIAFDIHYTLPLFLFALSKIYETGIYDYKIERVINEITPFIMSRYGYLDSKRLYMLWGISKINRHIRDERLTGFCKLLASQIDSDRLLSEFRDKNIFIQRGLAGVCLLMLTMDEDMKQHLATERFYAQATKKLENSSVWRVLKNEMPMAGPISLPELCGAIMIYNAMTLHK
jgi:hypothetical protein